MKCLTNSSEFIWRLTKRNNPALLFLSVGIKKEPIRFLHYRLCLFGQSRSGDKKNAACCWVLSFSSSREAATTLFLFVCLSCFFHELALSPLSSSVVFDSSWPRDFPFFFYHREKRLWSVSRERYSLKSLLSFDWTAAFWDGCASWIWNVESVRGWRGLTHQNTRQGSRTLQRGFKRALKKNTEPKPCRWCWNHAAAAAGATALIRISSVIRLPISGRRGLLASCLCRRFPPSLPPPLPSLLPPLVSSRGPSGDAARRIAAQGSPAEPDWVPRMPLSRTCVAQS